MAPRDEQSEKKLREAEELLRRMEWEKALALITDARRSADPRVVSEAEKLMTFAVRSKPLHAAFQFARKKTQEGDLTSAQELLDEKRADFEGASARTDLIDWPQIYGHLRKQLETSRSSAKAKTGPEAPVPLKTAPVPDASPAPPEGAAANVIDLKRPLSHRWIAADRRTIYALAGGKRTLFIVPLGDGLVHEHPLTVTPVSGTTVPGFFVFTVKEDARLYIFDERARNLRSVADLKLRNPRIQETCVPPETSTVIVMGDTDRGSVAVRVRLPSGEQRRVDLGGLGRPAGLLSRDGSMYYSGAQRLKWVTRLFPRPGKLAVIEGADRNLRSVDFEPFGFRAVAPYAGFYDRHLQGQRQPVTGSIAFHPDLPYFVEATKAGTFVFRDVLTLEPLHTLKNRLGGSRPFLRRDDLVVPWNTRILFYPYDSKQIMAKGPVAVAEPPPNRVLLGKEFRYKPTFRWSRKEPLQYYLGDAPEGARIDGKGEIVWTPDVTTAMQNRKFVSFELRLRQGDTPKGSYRFSVFVDVPTRALGSLARKGHGAAGNPVRVEATPDGTYLAGLLGGLQSAVLLPLRKPGEPIRLQVANDPIDWCIKDRRLYVAHRVSQTVTVHSLDTLEPVGKIRVTKGRPELIAPVADKPLIYISTFPRARSAVSGKEDPALIEIRTDTMKEGRRIPLKGELPRTWNLSYSGWKMGATRDGSRIYITRDGYFPFAFDVRKELTVAGPDPVDALPEYERLLHIDSAQSRVITTRGIYDGVFNEPVVRFHDLAAADRPFLAFHESSSTILALYKLGPPIPTMRLAFLDPATGRYLHFIDLPYLEATGLNAVSDGAAILTKTDVVHVPFLDVLKKLGRKISPPATDAAAMEAYKDLMTRGRGLFDKGKFAEARALLAQALGRYRRGEAQVYLAECWRREGKIDTALEAYEIAATLPFDTTPELVRCHEVRGDLQAARSAPDLALEAYQAGLKLSPNSAVLHMKVARMHQSLDRLEDAVEAAQRAFELDPKLKDFASGLAKELYRRNSILCPPCAGIGKKGGMTCDVCGGSGEAVRRRCNECRGSGERYFVATVDLPGATVTASGSKSCSPCEGRGYTLEKKR